MTFLSFGEILFDVFPTQKKLGGAPLNVSAHLTKLGAKGAIISALGKDDMGKEALSAIQRLNIDTSFIRESEYETGRADITLIGKSADYTFNSPCAWDDIKVEKQLPNEVDLIYFGTLAQRSAISKETLKYVLENVKAKEIFFDVNIRKNFYTPEILKEGISKATILKMNDEECPIIGKALSIAEDIEGVVNDLFKTSTLKMILITKGKEGTALYTRNKCYTQGCKDVKVIDTVGAGDSLSSGFLHTFLTTNDEVKALKVGATLADFVVTQPGAIPEYTDELIKEIKEVKQ